MTRDSGQVGNPMGAPVGTLSAAANRGSWLARRYGVEKARRYRQVSLGTLGYLVLSAGAAISIFPLYWMLITSLKLTGMEFLVPPQLVPDPFAWNNYRSIFEFAPFHIYFRNSFTVVFLATLGTLLSSSLVAFGFARLRFWGRDTLFIVLLSTLMLPEAVVLIPTFILYREFGWLDTLLPLWVKFWFGGAAFYVFLLRQYFRTLPLDLDEAALCDGASHLRLFWQIIMPLAGPALAAVAIFSFVQHWDDFLHPLVFTSSVEVRTVALGLRSFIGDEGNVPWNLLMAASTVSLVPVLILFAIAQKYFISGIQLTGLTGR